MGRKWALITTIIAAALATAACGAESPEGTVKHFASAMGDHDASGACENLGKKATDNMFVALTSPEEIDIDTASLEELKQQRDALQATLDAPVPSCKTVVKMLFKATDDFTAESAEPTDVKVGKSQARIDSSVASFKLSLLDGEWKIVGITTHAG